LVSCNAQIGHRSCHDTTEEREEKGQMTEAMGIKIV